MNKELEEKLKVLSEEDLVAHIRATKIAERLVDIIAISIIVLTLMFTNIFTIALTCFSVYMLSSLAGSIGETRAYIRKLIDRR